MAEWGMAEIVGERDRLREIFVERKHAGDGPRNLGNFQRMRQPGAVVIALMLDETWVLCFSRRNEAEWIMRSRSRW